MPEKPEIEMLSPCAWVSTSWFDELTLAVMPVWPVAWLIWSTSEARPACDTEVTEALIVTVLVGEAPVPLPSTKENDPAVTVKATLVSATALTLVFEVALLIA